MGSAATPRGLLIREVDHAFRGVLPGLLHGEHVGRMNGGEVANLACEGSPGKGSIEGWEVVGVVVSVHLGEGFSRTTDEIKEGLRPPVVDPGIAAPSAAPKPRAPIEFRGEWSSILDGCRNELQKISVVTRMLNSTAGADCVSAP